MVPNSLQTISLIILPLVGILKWTNCTMCI
jgi:hypothetical protein